MPHFAETVLQQKGTVDAATERDANMGYQLLAQLNDQLCNKKVVDNVSEWRVEVTWTAHALPADKLLTLLTIVPQGSEYRIVQVYGGDSVNQLLLETPHPQIRTSVDSHVFCTPCPPFLC